MAEQQNEDAQNVAPKKQILLNAFDMSTVGHLSPGQLKVYGNILIIKKDYILKSI